MFENILTFHERRENLRQELKPAELTGANSCQGSGFCCWQRPAELTMGDIQTISFHFEMTESEFFLEYCRVDSHMRTGDKYIVRLKREKETGGKFISFPESYDLSSPCVFLIKPEEKYRCGVHKIKPKTCREMKCWTESDGDGKIPLWTRAEVEALGWEPEKDQAWKFEHPEGQKNL